MSIAVSPASMHLFRQHRREESYRALLVRLFVLLETTQAGGPRAERFAAACAAFRGELFELLEREGSLLLAEREGHLFFNGVRARIDLAGFTALKFLVRTLLARELSGFLLMQGLTDAELQQFFELFLSPAPHAGQTFCDELEQRGVRCIQPVLRVEGEFAEILGHVLESGSESPRRPTSYFKSIFLLRHLLSGLEGSRLVDFAEAKDLLLELVEFVLDEDGVLTALDHLKGSDPALYRHGVESAVLAQQIGRELGLEGELLLRLGVCALLHDFGHARPGDGAGERLSFQLVMGEHCFSELVLESAIVAHAHENLDELEGELDPQTELLARIVHATERFARLVTRGRVYGLDPVRVVRRLEQHGLAPHFVRALREIARRLSPPAGTSEGAPRAPTP